MILFSFLKNLRSFSNEISLTKWWKNFIEIVELNKSLNLTTSLIRVVTLSLTLFLNLNLTSFDLWFVKFLNFELSILTILVTADLIFATSLTSIFWMLLKFSRWMLSKFSRWMLSMSSRWMLLKFSGWMLSMFSCWMLSKFSCWMLWKISWWLL